MLNLSIIICILISPLLSSAASLSRPNADGPSLLSGRAPTHDKYKAAAEAALEAGSYLFVGKWYYFRICDILETEPANDLQSKTGCGHHRFLAGVVSSSSGQKKFEGTYYDVTWHHDDGPLRWVTRSHNWEIHAGQKLVYGGQTNRETASVASLYNLSLGWAMMTTCRDLGDNNCYGFYNYMANNM